jgi:hypothetical protein
MANLAQMLKQLRDERNRTAKELDRLDQAIAAFGKLVKTPAAPVQAKKTRGRRKLSAAARKRISDAQKARWAKMRKQKAS